MKITKRMSYNEYWKNKPQKRGSEHTSKSRCGDNIYYKSSKGNWIQKAIQYHNDEKSKKHDTQTDAVLISNHFFYFGKSPIQLPEYFEKLVNNLPREKYKGMEIAGKRLTILLKKEYKKGKHGDPIDYKDFKDKCMSKNLRRKSCKKSFKLCG